MGKLEQQVPNCKSKEIKSRTTGNENIPSHTNEVQDADTCNCCSYEGGGGGVVTMMIMMMRTVLR